MTADIPEETEAPKIRHFKGIFSNGMKGDSLFFDVSADGRKVQDLTFKGWWYCSGKLESIIMGPDGSFPLKNGVADSFLVEPPNGGSTAWRFDLSVKIAGKQASGSFRSNINNLGCNTGMLQFTAREF